MKTEGDFRSPRDREATTGSRGGDGDRRSPTDGHEAASNEPTPSDAIPGDAIPGDAIPGSDPRARFRDWHRRKDEKHHRFHMKAFRNPDGTMSRPHCFVRAGLHRRIFMTMGATIFFAALIAYGVVSLLGGPQSKRDFEGAQSFLQHRFAAVWEDAAQRKELAESVRSDLDVDVTLHDPSGAVLDAVGASCDGRVLYTTPVDYKGQTLGSIDLCSDRRVQNHTTVIAAVVAACLGMWLLSAMVTKKIARSLEELERAATEIGMGRYDTQIRLHPHAPSEYFILAEAMRDMAAKIKEQMAEQRELLASVSHEIRSPLARIRLLLELARPESRPSTDDALAHSPKSANGRDEVISTSPGSNGINGHSNGAPVNGAHGSADRGNGCHTNGLQMDGVSSNGKSSNGGYGAHLRDHRHDEPSPEEMLRDKAFTDMEREIEEIDDLVGALLANSRVDFSALTVRSLDLKAACERALERAGIKAPLAIDGRLQPVEADATLVARAVANLLENATTHGDGVESIRVTFQGSAVRVDVLDRGPGFQPGEEEKIFQSFYRRPSKSHESLGLGLALVRRIAEAHGGSASAQNRAKGGASVGFEIPLVHAST